MNYRGKAHKEIFERAIERSLDSSNETVSALYLLTADKYLWSQARHHIGKSGIDFSEIKLSNASTEAYTLFMAAKDLYLDEKHIGLSDLADVGLITNKMFGLLCNALAIRRYGLKAIMNREKAGDAKC